MTPPRTMEDALVASLLTDQVHTRVAAIAARYGVSVDAALQLLQALASTGGRMAQFNHPDLGGSGQWMQGGMTMIGDMFNNSLKATVDSLCRDLAGLLAELPPQALAERGTAEGPLPEAVAHLGTPDWRGSQNEMTYAYYAAAHRLVVTRAGKTVVHDTGDHQLFGVSQQQQNGSQTLAFVGPGGVISLASLPVVAAPSEPPPAAGPAKPDTTQGPKSDVAQAGRPDIAPSGTPGRGIPEPSVLAGSLWRFSPDDAPAMDIGLLADGTISGGGARYYYWSAEEGVLRLFADDGRTSARFDAARTDSAGQVTAIFRQGEAHEALSRRTADRPAAALTLTLDLAAHPWELSDPRRKDALPVRFLPDGSITDGRPQDRRWSVKGDVLTLHHASGRPTARFDSFTWHAGQWLLNGVFLDQDGFACSLRQK